MEQKRTTQSLLKLGILGIRGRMGQAILQEASRSPEILITAGTTRELSPSLPSIFLTDSSRDVFERADLVLDFSHPEAITSHLEEAVATQKPLLIGTTGFSAGDLQKIHEAATKIPLLYAPNTSFGIALLQKLIREVAKTLDFSYDVEILDIHHRHKRDSPSGTTLLLEKAVQEGRIESSRPPGERSSGDRNGLREQGTIGLSSIRGGNLKGEHQVHFMGPHERIMISHESFGRELFAQGALTAALWLRNKTPGFYTMTDVFGLDDSAWQKMQKT